MDYDNFKFLDIAQTKLWPFDQARKLLTRIEQLPPDTEQVLFATGYGPSGLPHIGTFGEVVRTAMVRRAFTQICDLPTKLVCFSDDLDALRKLPDNIPNPEQLEPHLGKPLTSVPDPFGCCSSFGHHNNVQLRSFLDRFGIDYEFLSATLCYHSGMFDQLLVRILQHHEQIRAAVAPSLSPDRRQTYSPFLPISPVSGQLLQDAVCQYRPDKGCVVFEDEAGEVHETPVTSGRCKLQWKPDWGMRWAALGVDYEMNGKDLVPSRQVAGKVCRLLGARAPEGMIYELFLDEQGHKISKSQGNGLEVEQWLTYAPVESLKYYMYLKPHSAKRLGFGVIPQTVDEYLTHLQDYTKRPSPSSPMWHVHAGQVPKADHAGLSYSLLMNLAGAANAENRDILWGFISRYAPESRPDRCPSLDRLVGHAVQYYHDFVKPNKVYRSSTDQEREALLNLEGRLLIHIWRWYIASQSTMQSGSELNFERQSRLYRRYIEQLRKRGEAAAVLLDICERKLSAATWFHQESRRLEPQLSYLLDKTLADLKNGSRKVLRKELPPYLEKLGKLRREEDEALEELDLECEEASPFSFPRFKEIPAHQPAATMQYVEPSRSKLATTCRPIWSEFSSPLRLQELVYEVGKQYFGQDLKSWFKCLYEVLLGQESGPRMGTFISLYGIPKTVDLIRLRIGSEKYPGTPLPVPSEDELDNFTPAA